MEYHCTNAARRAVVGVVLAGIGLLLAPGCGIINPDLLGTVLPNSTIGIPAPEGTIVIAVLNRSPAIVAAQVQVTKIDGGVVDLTIPVQPFDSSTANPADRAFAVQDCDVYSIRLVQILAGLPTGGAVQQFASSLPPLVDGVELSCGKLVTITVVGTPPNLQAAVEVY
ncbi:MAG: hypothetical protein KA354_08180 [Phycisphaerae bacterium]|nr:hypothetical protein [Phycisphaerae bacterium]